MFEKAEWQRENRQRDPERYAAYWKKYYDKNKEKMLAKNIAYRTDPANREKISSRSREYGKKYNEANKVRHANTSLLRRRGVTQEQKAAILAAQGGMCAGCGTTDPGDRKGWHLDHCHATDKNRGVLCRKCNLALGHVTDNPVTLRALAAYVERYKCLT